jgi:hypothetical protein
MRPMAAWQWAWRLWLVATLAVAPWPPAAFAAVLPASDAALPSMPCHDASPFDPVATQSATPSATPPADAAGCPEGCCDDPGCDPSRCLGAATVFLMPNTVVPDMPIAAAVRDSNSPAPPRRPSRPALRPPIV